jgi:hypothetical protein
MEAPNCFLNRKARSTTAAGILVAGGEMLRRLWRVFAPACALFLAGCTGSSFMGVEVSDYRTMFNVTGDEQILVNILRAKDNAPLHFAELQTLGAGNQLSSTLTPITPIGQPNPITPSATLQGMFSAQTTPSFSLSTLEVQQFTQGLTLPVDTRIIQQLFEEGIDQRLIFLLFFSAFTDGANVYLNNIRPNTLDPNYNLEHFFAYLHEVDYIAEKHRVVARPYFELTRIGASVSWSATTGVKDLAGIDPDKYRIETDPNDPTKAIVYAVSPQRLALCWVMGKDPQTWLKPVLPDRGQGICTRDRVYARAKNASAGLTIRSPYQIIEYLGQILNYQEQRADENRCIQLGSAWEHRRCDEGDVLFQVNPARGSPLVTTSYRGSPYSIGVGRCELDYCDHSAEVMKIVNLLINYNKSAAIIPQVQTVRTLQ